MHEAVGPAKDRGRQHEVELFECAQARLAELAAFVNYQLRVVAGLKLLRDVAVP